MSKKSKTGDHWTTPVRIVEALRLFHGGQIDLDPCSNPKSIVGARVEWFGPPHGVDGTVAMWFNRGLTYWNPPYSDKATWAKRAREQHIYRRVQSIGLIPADTDTAWFHNHCWTAPLRCFLEGRLSFGGDVAYGARFPSVLIYWGRRVERFREIFKAYGHVT